VTVRRIGAGVEDMMEDVLGMAVGTELRWRMGEHMRLSSEGPR
jgi:hypothetical protein